MLRTVSVSAPLLGATAVSITADKVPKNTQATVENKIRPSDLPIYSPVSDLDDKSCKAHPMEKASGPRGAVEDGLAVVRENVTSLYHIAQTHTHRLDDFYQTGKAHSQVAVEYLNEPGNSLPRAGAIALGAASGFILGLRHGRIRRLLYTAIGGGALASVCYPNDAKVYANQALTEAKAAAKIGYNFAYGVKPGDEPNYPKIPTTSSELLSAATDLVNVVKDKISSATVTGEKSK